METSLWDLDKLESIANKIKVMGHPQRIAMIALFGNENELTVSEIQDRMNIEQAVASNHLRILRDHHIVTFSRKGRNKYYTLRNSTLDEVVSYLNK